MHNVVIFLLIVPFCSQFVGKFLVLVQVTLQFTFSIRLHLTIRFLIVAWSSKMCAHFSSLAVLYCTPYFSGVLVQ